MYHAPPLPGLILFPVALILLDLLGIGLATLVDSSIWVPKRYGFGYAINPAHPLAWLMLAYMVGSLVLILYGISHPDAPGISGFMELLSRIGGIG
jgi:hypothetical protein